MSTSSLQVQGPFFSRPRIPYGHNFNVFCNLVFPRRRQQLVFLQCRHETSSFEHTVISLCRLGIFRVSLPCVSYKCLSILQSSKYNNASPKVHSWTTLASSSATSSGTTTRFPSTSRSPGCTFSAPPSVVRVPTSVIQHPGTLFSIVITPPIVFIKSTHRCIRLRLYSSNQPKGDDSAALIDDEIDFPLEPNGDLDFHRVKLWWGIQVCTVRFSQTYILFLPFVSKKTMKTKPNTRAFCVPHQPLLPYSWDLFTKSDAKNINKISGIAVHNLTAGYQRKMSLLCP